MYYFFYCNTTSAKRVPFTVTSIQSEEYKNIKALDTTHKPEDFHLRALNQKQIIKKKTVACERMMTPHGTFKVGGAKSDSFKGLGFLFCPGRTNKRQQLL